MFPDAGAKKRDNSLCANGAECTSGFCVLSDEKMNICCNSACSGPCVQCVSGVCQPKIGAPCGDGICKTCDEAGACQLRTTLCAEKSSNGTDLFNCSAADKQCAAGQCVACAAVPGAALRISHGVRPGWTRAVPVHTRHCAAS